jgi:hypothetical protein
VLWNIIRADVRFAPPIALLSPSPPPSLLLPSFCFYRARENPRPFRHESFFGRVGEHFFFWHPQRIQFPLAFFFFVEVIDEMLHALQARLNALESFVACKQIIFVACRFRQVIADRFTEHTSVGAHEV